MRSGFGCHENEFGEFEDDATLLRNGRSNMSGICDVWSSDRGDDFGCDFGCDLGVRILSARKRVWRVTRARNSPEKMRE